MRWLFGGILILVTLAAEAVLGSRAGASLLSADGGHIAGFLQTYPSGTSILTSIIALIVGGSLAMIYRWRGYPSLALLHAGVWLIAFAAFTGGFNEFILQDAGVISYVVECVIWAVVVALIAVVLLRQPEGQELSDTAEPSLSFGSVFGLLVCLAMMAVVVWLFARSQMKGQTLSAVVIASILLGLFGSFLIGRRLQPLLFAMPPLVGGAGAAFAWWQHQSIGLMDIGAGWTPLALPMPQDYAAGALLGVALGIAWSRAFVTEDQAHPTPPAVEHDAAPAGNTSM